MVAKQARRAGGGILHARGEPAGRRRRPGGVLLFISEVPAGSKMGLTTDGALPGADDFKEFHECLFDPARERFHFAGFHFASGLIDALGNGAVTWKFDATIVPYWILVILLALLPMRMFRHGWTRFDRWRRGNCLNCGYDIRASTERCPECGKPIRTKGSTASLAADEAPARSAPRPTISVLLALSIGVLIGVIAHHRAARAAASSQRAQLLARPVKDLNLANASLGEAIDLLRRRSGLRIDVDWDSLEISSINQDRRVDLYLSDTTLGAALRSILHQLGGPDSDYFFAIERGRVVMASPQNPARTAKIYDTGGIMRAVDKGVGASEHSGFPPADSASPSDTILRLVEDVVETDSWRDNGGSIGDARTCGNRLLVVQTPELQARIGSLLAQL